MQTLRFNAVIDERRTLSLVLPDGVCPGKAEVIVTVGMEEPGPKFTPMSDEEFEKLMRFGDGRRLGGLSLKEMAAEGRR